MGDHKALDTEALALLINAVADYHDKLMKHYKVIQNAANLCDQAMGSDALSKKQINKLYETTNELLITSDRAREMAEKLLEEGKKAQDIYDMF